VNARVLPLVAGDLLLALVPVLVLVLPQLLMLLDVLLLDSEDCESMLWWDSEFDLDTVFELARP